MHFKTSLLAFGLLAALSTNAFAKGNLQGAWTRTAPGPNGDPVKEVILFSGDYFSWTAFAEKTGAFIETRGGIFSMENDQLILKFEFNSSDTTKVGLSEEWAYQRLGEHALRQDELDHALRFFRQAASASPRFFPDAENGVAVTLEKLRHR